MSKVKVKLKIEVYTPNSEYAEGRIFFGSKGVYSNIKIYGFLTPIINLIEQMNIKYISWKVIKYPIPEALYPYIKPKKLEMLKQRQANIISPTVIPPNKPQ